MGKHSEWRKLAKKARRKRIRQQLAKKRDDAILEEEKRKENSPSYAKWLKEQELIEKYEKEEEVRLAAIAEKEWLKREEEAHERWKLLQVKLQQARDERIKQNERIRQEWEFEQKRLKEIIALKEKQEEDKKRHQDQLLEEINNFIEHGGEIPDSLKTNLETNPNKEICPFFKKTGACRFNDTCSRNHVRPGISKILLFPNFYSHYSLEQVENEYGNDSTLEFETYEVYNHFKEFFYDVVHEIEKYGVIRQFKVCCNVESHLRGNVYVEFSNCHEAIKSYKIFQGRWYGGKQINVEFCNIESWKYAVCGQFYKKTCPKGNACNFLHVFRNPNNLYSYTEKDSIRKSPDSYESSQLSRNWRWSESPERILSTANGTHATRNHSDSHRTHSKHHKRSRSRSSRRHSHSSKKRRKRSRSKSSTRSHKSSKRKSLN